MCNLQALNPDLLSVQNSSFVVLLTEKCISVPLTGSHLCRSSINACLMCSEIYCCTCKPHVFILHNLSESNSQLSCHLTHIMTVFSTLKQKGYLFVCLFSYYLQDFRLHLNSWFAVFLILSPLHLPSCLGQHSSTGSYPLPAASFLPLGLLKLLPRSILPFHISLTANKLLTLLSVIKNRKAFSPLSCKPFFLLTTDSPKQILQTKTCSQTTDLTNGNQTNHYSTDRQTN